MAHSLVIGDDHNIAAWAFAAYRKILFKYNRVYGILDNDKKLAGAILLHNYNGVNIDLSYYGTRTMTVGIICSLARAIICEFNPARLSVIVSKRNRSLIRSLHRCGWRLEGAQRRYYGHLDVNRNVGVCFVLFQEQIERLASGLVNSPALEKQG